MATRTTVAHRVSDALEQDSTALDMLRRRLVNLRAFARWLIQTHRWDADEEAVVSALRRYQGRLAVSGSTVFGAARTVLAASHVNSRSRMCSVAVRTDRDVRRWMPQLFDAVDHEAGEKIRIISSDQGFKIILDETNLERARSILGPQRILETKQGLTEFDVVIPTGRSGTPGILALVANALALRRVDIKEAIDGINQHMLLVDSRQAHDAYEALTALMDRQAHDR